MKKFSFPLGRVLDWRDTQARIEESKLEALYAELRGIAAREAALIQARALAQTSVTKASSVTGADLAALDSFRRFTIAEHTRLETLRGDCARRIAAQIQIVAAKRRDVRLLERLKQQRVKTWQHEYAREIDAQAEESYLARWKPVNASKPLQ